MMYQCFEQLLDLDRSCGGGRGDRQLIERRRAPLALLGHHPSKWYARGGLWFLTMNKKEMVLCGCSEQEGNGFLRVLRWQSLMPIADASYEIFLVGIYMKQASACVCSTRVRSAAVTMSATYPMHSPSGLSSDLLPWSNTRD
jgi:hypothetical protein